MLEARRKSTSVAAETNVLLVTVAIIAAVRRLLPVLWKAHILNLKMYAQGSTTDWSMAMTKGEVTGCTQLSHPGYIDSYYLRTETT
jgi:hypothetical protein